MRPTIIALLSPILLGGCIAYTAASTAVSVTATAVEAAADVTGAVVGGAADLVTGGDDEDDD